ncbi:hypothetical protein CYMTET_32986, partial [Cymbomonas tetramitiformis]
SFTTIICPYIRKSEHVLRDTYDGFYTFYYVYTYTSRQEQVARDALISEFNPSLDDLLAGGIYGAFTVGAEVPPVVNDAPGGVAAPAERVVCFYPAIRDALSPDTFFSCASGWVST